MTESEKLLHEIELLLKPILIKGRGIDFGSDNTPIKAVDIQKSEMLTIQNYRGHQVKIIIKKL
jgi:hypothetical protein